MTAIVISLVLGYSVGTYTQEPDVVEIEKEVNVWHKPEGCNLQKGDIFMLKDVE